MTRKQQSQLDDIEHFLNLALTYLANDRNVVAMKSSGAATTEFHNARSGEWIVPVQPTSLRAYLNHAQRAVEAMRSDAASNGGKQ
ncbi:hypothetical protein [Streptomyces chrestomyceticus]|uniref:hypothetical protein n=1 Tax=Streptomyces chrestomyceticus TaxID=68185 RepID=UPI0033ED0D4F